MRPAVLCVALTACTALNPAFDQPGPSTSAGETSPSTTSPGESTQPVDPTTSSTSSLSMTQSGTSGPGDSSTSATSEPASTSDSSAGPLCAAQNEACDLLACCGECATCTNGTCVLDDALCGTCGVCVAGSCEPAKQNTPCVPDQDDCPNRVWGLVNGVCYATKPGRHLRRQGRLRASPTVSDQGAVSCCMCDPKLRPIADNSCSVRRRSTSSRSTVDVPPRGRARRANASTSACNQDTAAVANAPATPNGMCVQESTRSPPASPTCATGGLNAVQQLHVRRQTAAPMHDGPPATRAPDVCRRSLTRCAGGPSCS
jgi:hypothetical protein